MTIFVGRMRLHFNRHSAAPLVWTIAALGERPGDSEHPATIVVLYEIAVAGIECSTPITTHYAPKSTPDDEDGKASAWLETEGILTIVDRDGVGCARIEAP